MLIDSPRLTAADRSAWAALERYDRALAGSAAVDRAADKARKAIEEFAADGRCYLSCSWGKDSVAVLHLMLTSTARMRIPVVYVTHDDQRPRAENPDCPAVRDAFFARFGQPPAGYTEMPGRVTPPTRLPEVMGTHRRITGIRAAESDQRAMSAAIHGVATDLSCRPILRWSDATLWAYLARHDLPIHPAYAMTEGGVRDRSRLRVHSVGGSDGGRHRWDWESRYYPDIVGAIRQPDALHPYET